MKTIHSFIFGAAAIAALTIGCFIFELSAFMGSLFIVMAVAFVVIALIIATQED